MPRGNWNVLVALAGIAALFTTLGLGWVSGYALNQPDKERYQPYRIAADERSQIKPPTPGQASAQPFEYRVPCHNPKGGDESDLCAQWKAAKAAEDSAGWAKWGFWIGVVGSFFLAWQIILTRRAVEDTGAATEAMRESNRIASEMAKRQLRAYLTIKEATPKNLPTIGELFEATLILVNAGETTASNVRCHTTIAACRVGTDADLIPALTDNEPSMTVLARGGDAKHFIKTAVPLDAMVQEAVINHVAIIYIHGFVAYADVFGDQHRLDFHFLYDPQINGFYAAEKGNHEAY